MVLLVLVSSFDSLIFSGNVQSVVAFFESHANAVVVFSHFESAKNTLGRGLLVEEAEVNVSSRMCSPFSFDIAIVVAGFSSEFCLMLCTFASERSVLLCFFFEFGLRLL